MRLTDEEYWDKGYKSIDFYDQSTHDVANFLNKYLKDGYGKTSLEVGSFPGSFIPTIARKGYLVNGVDFNKGNSTALPAWLKSFGFEVGTFWTADFFDFIKVNSDNFDLVCSFGLIEHFKNYEEVIEAHIKLLKPGGQLIITTPNFRGLLQYLPHKLLDKENLNKHFLPSMRPKEWKKILERNGFQVDYHGYFGGYYFWVDRFQPRNKIEKLLLRFTERLISQFNKLFLKIKLQSSSFSSYCGIVATKNEGA